MDFDNDLDIILGNEDGELYYLENQGTADSASFVEINDYFQGINASHYCAPAAADVDQDGDIDLLIGNIFGDVKYYEKESGSWIDNSSLFAGVSASQNATPAFGDIDGDGDLDLTVGDYDGTFHYFENTAETKIESEELKFSPASSRVSRIYPNPFNSTITFEINGNQTGRVTISFYDLTGRKIYEKQYYLLDNSTSYISIIFSPGIPAGVYLYDISFKTGELSIKNHSGKILYLK